MKTQQFFLYLSFVALVPVFNATSNERDIFLQDVFCPTKNPKDLPKDARSDYDAIQKRSTSWCAWFGICTPNKKDALKALQTYVQDKSQEYARTQLQQRPPVSQAYVNYVSHIILSQLTQELQKYEDGYPYCGLLNSFLGASLQSKVQTLIKEEQEKKDREPYLIIYKDHFATVTLSRRLVEEL